MNLKNILNKDDKFTCDEITNIVNIKTKEDYVTMNYIEKKLIELQGKDFLQKSHHKVQHIMSMILDENIEDLYDFYSGSFDEYMKICNNNYSQIGSFNLTFATLIHVSVKILRRYSI